MDRPPVLPRPAALTLLEQRHRRWSAPSGAGLRRQGGGSGDIQQSADPPGVRVSGVVVHRAEMSEVRRRVGAWAACRQNGTPASSSSTSRAFGCSAPPGSSTPLRSRTHSVCAWAMHVAQALALARSCWGPLAGRSTPSLFGGFNAMRQSAWTVPRPAASSRTVESSRAFPGRAAQHRTRRCPAVQPRSSGWKKYQGPNATGSAV